VTYWERYEIWIPDGSDWRLESSWQDMDFASAALQAHNGPARLVRASCDDEKVIERSTVIELEGNPSVSSQSSGPAPSHSAESAASALPLVKEDITMRFVAGHPESRILLYGCGLYLASNMVGQGLGMPSDPRAGLMAAAAGVLMCGLSIVRCKGSEQMRVFVAVLRAALLAGFTSFVITLVAAAMRPFFDLNNSRWGAIPPPWLIFSAVYGVTSLVGSIGAKRFLSSDLLCALTCREQPLTR